MSTHNPSARTMRVPSRCKRWLAAGAAGPLLALSACGGDSVDRGPTTIPVTAKLDGVY